MKKEVIIAILLGFAIGLIITFGIYRAQKAYQARDQVQKSDDPTSPAGQPAAAADHPLSILFPNNESISDTSPITISGSTTPDSFVTAVTASAQSATKADPQGSFSLEIELDAGANLIKLTSIDPSGNSASLDLTVTYSTADLSSETNSDSTQDQ